jgi:phosphate-selective porin
MRPRSIRAGESGYYALIGWVLTGASREARLVRAARFCACNRKRDSATSPRLASIRDTGCRFNDVRLSGEL